MGTRDIKTPNLDRLASKGVLFNQAYSNNPVCSPFRIHLMTGRYSSDTGTMNNCDAIPESALTLPQQFNRAGYATSYVGKWHVGGKGNGPIPANLKAGFERFIGYQCYNGFEESVCFYDEQHTERCYDRHRTDVTTDIALERLDEIKDGPFIQYVCYQAPHYPEQPSDQFYDLYRGKILEKRPNYVEGVEPFTPTFSPPSPKDWQDDRDFRRYGGDMDEYLRCYYGMVSQIDHNVGRLIAYLEQNDLWENTAVFFMSDHGDMQGSHGAKNKCLPWEESAGIPMIGRIPGGLRGHISEDYVSGIDTYPTFLELADIENQAKVSGTSFAKLLASKERESRVAISEGMHLDWTMICRENYKLVIDRPTKKPQMLFHIGEDPYELNNLVDDPKETDRIAKLQKELLETLPD